jgi:pimeloyl-ACP methyl ester carboxylesterase
VIAAADDPSSPREDARLIEQTVPRARLVVLPHAAHLANVERASDFTRAVLEHLTGEAANEGP